MIYKSIQETLSNDYAGESVHMRGWIHRLRKQKENVFVTLRDSTGIIQCVLPRTPETNNLTRESSIEIQGEVFRDERAPGGYELHAKEANVVGPSENYPIGRDQSQELLNENRHLWLRSTKMTNIMKIRSSMLSAVREWFSDQAWYETSPPILNKSAAEGGSTLFEVPFFDESVYLSQSAQLYLEALTFSLGNVWSLTPSFRAEKSKTPRHLAEYWHLEGEQAWASFDDILSVEEQLIEYTAHAIAEHNFQELEVLGSDPNDLAAIQAPFDRITYKDAIRFLNTKGRALSIGDDLGTDDERQLTANSLQPVFLYGAPKAIKPFYTKVDPEDSTMVLSADMLAPKGLGEISTGGQREEGLTSIVERIKEEGFNPKDYSWYLDIRRHGSIPHSGFGFGIERLVRWMCDLEHVRDAIPFPRSMARAYP